MVKTNVHLYLYNILDTLTPALSTTLMNNFRFRCVRSPHHLPVLSLSMADLLMMTKTPVVMVNAAYGGPALGQAGAKVGRGREQAGAEPGQT